MLADSRRQQGHAGLNQRRVSVDLADVGMQTRLGQQKEIQQYKQVNVEIRSPLPPGQIRADHMEVARVKDQMGDVQAGNPQAVWD